ncbi:uncharacterized protein PV07_06032 [Cladophialophora immunda]|uniref:Uncharacterized protein n=1 Tax=Cladophialophora immunda TaxID=569365 RepID=A0A0D2AYA7_9EURO|nr:uncharacterized protein PV07_06032 [Cladophialophora immunda]KIW30277.1 hypothetical protein PV07_06032 [Cladophialophora immunda]
MPQCIELCDEVDACNMVEIGPDDSGTVYCWGFTSVVSWVPTAYDGWDTALKVSGDFARDPVSGNTIDSTTTSAPASIITTSSIATESTSTPTSASVTTTSSITIDSTTTSPPVSITTTSTATIDSTSASTSAEVATTSITTSDSTSVSTSAQVTTTSTTNGDSITTSTSVITTTSTTTDSPTSAETFYIAAETGVASRKVKRGTEYLVLSPQTGLSSLVDSEAEASIFTIADDDSLMVVVSGTPVWVGLSFSTPTQLVMETEPPSPPVTAAIDNNGVLTISSVVTECILDGGHVASGFCDHCRSDRLEHNYKHVDLFFISVASPHNLGGDYDDIRQYFKHNYGHIDFISIASHHNFRSDNDDDIRQYFKHNYRHIDLFFIGIASHHNFGSDDDDIWYYFKHNHNLSHFNDYDACLHAIYDRRWCGESLEGATTGGLQYLPKQFAVNWQASDNYEGWTFDDALSRCAQFAVDNAATAVEFYIDVDQNWLCVGVNNVTFDDSSFYPDSNVINVWGFVWENSCQNTPLDDIIATDGTVFSEFYTGCSTSFQGNTPGGLQYLNRVVSVDWPAPDYSGWTFDDAVKSCADQTVSQGGTMFEFYIGSDDSWYCIAVNDLPVKADSFYPDATIGKVWGFAIAESTEVCEPSQLAGSIQLANGTTFDEFYDACHVSLEGNTAGGPGSMTNVFGFNNPPGDDGNHGGWTLETSLQQCITDSAAAGATLVEFYENADEDPTWYCFGVNDVPAQEDSFYGDGTVGRLWAFKLDESTLPTSG